MKVFLFDKLSKDVPSFGALPRGAWTVLGIVELVCAVGLIVPALFHWRPSLTVAAAVILALETLVLHLGAREVPRDPAHRHERGARPPHGLHRVRPAGPPTDLLSVRLPALTSRAGRAGANAGVAARPGVEPGLRDPKPPVLPIAPPGRTSDGYPRRRRLRCGRGSSDRSSTGVVPASRFRPRVGPRFGLVGLATEASRAGTFGWGGAAYDRTGSEETRRRSPMGRIVAFLLGGLALALYGPLPLHVGRPARGVRGVVAGEDRGRLVREDLQVRARASSRASRCCSSRSAAETAARARTTRSAR